MPNATAHALVYLHTGKLDLTTGQPLPEEERKRPIAFIDYLNSTAQRADDGNADPQAVANGLAYFRGLEDRVERINRSNLEHTWQAFVEDPETGRQRVRPVNPCLRQIHAGTFFRAVRLYSWGDFSGQNMPKAVRKTMLIDGERVAELDFHNMAIRMLYHSRQQSPAGDLYRPAKVMRRAWAAAGVADRAIIRDFIKTATNICLNVASRAKANSAVGKALIEHEHGDLLREAVYKAEGIGPAGVVDRIARAHPTLAQDLFTEIGLELMTTDSKIMLRILTAFAKARKPALGLHDAVVVKASDATFAGAVMAWAYYNFIQFKPVIKRAY